MKLRMGRKYSAEQICLAMLILIPAIAGIFPQFRGYLGIITSNLLAFTCYFILLGLFMLNSHVAFPSGGYTCGILAFMIYLVGSSYLLGNAVWGNRYISLMFFILAPASYKFLLHKDGGIRVLKILEDIVLVFSAITFILTFDELLLSPWASRRIKYSGEATEALVRAGIGGYEFIYYCMLLGIAFFYMYMNRGKRIRYLILSILTLSLMLLSNYFTATLLFLLGVLIALFENRKLQTKFFFVVVLVIVACILLVSQNFIDFILTILPEGRIRSTVAEFDSNLLSGIFEEFISDRWPTIQVSIDAILNHPLVGVQFQVADLSFQSLGQHSMIFDTLAIWGIPMGCLFLYLMFRPLALPSCILIPFIGLMVLNNATPSIAFAVGLLIPTLLLESEKGL